jgi:protocatechuate 3,4-dioxygenase beta subunit
MSHDHDLGFHHDLPHLLGRRAVFLGIGSVVGSVAGMMASGASAQGVCAAMAPEMAGPFPANGTPTRRPSLALNILTDAGVIRQDIRPSLGGLKPVAQGTEFTLDLDLVSARRECAPIAEAALYLWQCDAAGRYSLYEDTDRNYLRGVGISDQRGKVQFTTIYPGCYNGRWPHFHFEVYANAGAAVSGQRPILTSQLALPEAESNATYASSRTYRQSARNMRRQRFDRDIIWRDNTTAQKEQIMIHLANAGPSAGSGRFRGTCQIGLDV